MRSICENLCLLSLLFISLSLSTVGAATKKKAKKTPVRLTDELLRLCGSTPFDSKRQKKELTWLVEASGKHTLLLSTSPQHAAACWMLLHDRKQSAARSRERYHQRYALAVLHYSTMNNQTTWDWPMTVDEPWAEAVQGNWMSVRHDECNWYGIECTNRLSGRKVRKVILGYMKLNGILPRELYLLKSLNEIDVHGNDLQGILPHKMVDALGNLEYMYLHMNGFFGALHREIEGMTKLRELRVFGNYFAGTLPAEQLATLKNLEILDMYANFVTGTIPSELAKLKNLKSLDLHDNNLVGSVPEEICKMGLKELVVDCLGPNPEVRCSCCTACCRGLPNAKCVDAKTGAEL